MVVFGQRPKTKVVNYERETRNAERGIMEKIRVTRILLFTGNPAVVLL